MWCPQPQKLMLLHAIYVHDICDVGSRSLQRKKGWLNMTRRLFFERHTKAIWQIRDTFVNVSEFSEFVSISAKLSPEQFAGDLWSDISLAIAAASESKDCKIEPFFTVSKRYQPHTNSHHHIYKTYNHPWWSFMNCNQEAHGGHHRDASMLQFHGSAALERSYIAVRGKSYRVPKADGRLNAQLVLEGGQVDL